MNEKAIIQNMVASVIMSTTGVYDTDRMYSAYLERTGFDWTYLRQTFLHLVDQGKEDGARRTMPGFDSVRAAEQNEAFIDLVRSLEDTPDYTQCRELEKFLIHPDPLFQDGRTYDLSQVGDDEVKEMVRRTVGQLSWTAENAPQNKWFDAHHLEEVLCEVLCDSDRTVTVTLGFNAIGNVYVSLDTCDDDWLLKIYTTFFDTDGTLNWRAQLDYQHAPYNPAPHGPWAWWAMTDPHTLDVLFNQRGGFEEFVAHRHEELTSTDGSPN